MMAIYHCIFSVKLFLLAVSYAQSGSDMKPSGLSQGVYCEGCIATVKELLKKVTKKTGDSQEVKVIEAMEDICNLQNFGSYEYSPPKTGQACKYLMENYDEEIENILVAGAKDFEDKICYKLTEACIGVDRTKREKEELEVNINNEKQKLQAGNVKNDPEKFHVNINEEGAAAKLVDQIKMAVKNKKTDSDNGNDGDDDDDDDGGGGDNDDDDGGDNDNDGGDDDDDDDNKIDEDEDSDDADGENIENLTDKFEGSKTEL